MGKILFNYYPKVGLELLLEHVIFQNFLGEGAPNPRKERLLLPIDIHTITFRTPDLQILYTPRL